MGRRRKLEPVEEHRILYWLINGYGIHATSKYFRRSDTAVRSVAFRHGLSREQLQRTVEEESLAADFAVHHIVRHRRWGAGED